MICLKCGNKMRLDDTDYNYKDNYDNYWICDNCDTSCLEEVRFGITNRVSWYDVFGCQLNEDFLNYHLYKLKENKYD